MQKPNLLTLLEDVAATAAKATAGSLVKLIGKEVTVTVPTVKLVAVEKVLTEIGDETHVSSVAVVKIQGEVQGLLILSLDPDEAEGIINEAIEHQLGGVYIDQDKAVLSEVANIIAGTLLSSISRSLDLRLKQQALPVYTTDMLGAVLDPFIAEFGTKFNNVLLQQEVFMIPSLPTRLKLVAIIDPVSTNLMLQKITEKIEANHGAND
jgi:chemotaxis protein CheY-P-specific phosphatase CheC